MKIIADTNLLVRAAVMDDLEEAELAGALLRKAEIIAVPLPVLCEFVWVLARGYKKTACEIAVAIRYLIDSATVATDRVAAEAGLTHLDAGGDFADGIIVFEGAKLGGKTFVTFDHGAAALARQQGADVHLISKRTRSRK